MIALHLEPFKIALRAYVPREPKEASLSSCPAYSTDDAVLVLDAETTTDAYQNLLFGSCGIWIVGLLYRFIIFYDESLSRSQVKTLERFGGDILEGAQIEVTTTKEFVKSVFYPWAYNAKALLVGFNLPFDLSRLAESYGKARDKFKNGFSFKLSENKFHPRIRIKSLDSTKSFTEFERLTKTLNYRGRFLDLRTLAFAMTNEKMTLEIACEHFDSPTKKHQVINHGKITPDYIRYNVNDTLATHALFGKMLERFHELRVCLPPDKAYSPASLGKSYLSRMGIRPFLQKNPKFSKQALGHVMTTFYGGRSEVRIRKTPTKVRYMDFASMYPVIFSLMDLWSLLIANKIEYEDATEGICRLLEEGTLESVMDTDLWKKFPVIVQVKPNRDVLPVRTHLDRENVWNIGLCEVTSYQPLWYALPDVIASALLTGKSPKILKAIRFKPIEVEHGLTNIDVVGNIHVSKDENLIQKLVECRRIKKRERDRSSKGSPEYQKLDREQDVLKTIVNAISYGIFIEVNTDDGSEDVDVYGLRHWRMKASKKESFGRYFHPVIASMLTSGARLMIAMAEAWLKKHRGYYAFCDTDGIAVSPKHWKKLQDLFEPLNPFDKEELLLRLEKENFDNGRPVDLWFYGISAKRYVLYHLVDGEPEPAKWSLHGLGHLEREEGWEKELWTNILRHALGQIDEEELLSKYSGRYAISKFRVSTAHVFNKIRALNKGKPHREQVKPYNFLHVGQPAITNHKGGLIHPITNYGDPRLAPFQAFVDYATGQVYDECTEAYWKTLQSSIESYIDHPESKFRDGCETGKLHRKHAKVQQICYVGKESNELEQTEALGVDKDAYANYRVRR